MKEAVASLTHNPGFKFLLNKLEHVKAYLNRELVTGKHAEMKDVLYLQAGLYWAGWLQDELTKSQPKNPLHEPYDAQFDAFNAAEAALEVVGLGSN